MDPVSMALKTMLSRTGSVRAQVDTQGPNHIKKLEAQRHAVILELVQIDQMIRGKFGVAYRRCGTSTCWCARGKGHPVNRITWTEQARSRTKAIPAEDIEWIKQRTEAYRRFRKRRQALRVLEDKINAALDAFEAKTVQRTNKQRKYLS